MGKIIAIAGNTGVGKTTLTDLLAARLRAQRGLEQHAERPFQALFSQNLDRFGLHNQVDYLLLRAEQERAMRQADGIGIVDGGLDLDFYLFTRYFYQKGYLSAAEFALCQRLYALLRSLLPAPEVIVWMKAPLATVAQRYAQRGRSLEIARLDELSILQDLLEDWLANESRSLVIEVDASQEDPSYAAAIERLEREFDRQILK